MNPREFLAKWKINLTFVILFFLAVAFNITIGLTAGKTFLDSVRWAMAEIRPMDYLMFALFWYAFAIHRPKDDWHSSLISLNLAKSSTRK
jgi:hypothetical protein